MGRMYSVVCLFLVGTTSAIKVFGDYEEYTDYKQEDGLSGHWNGIESDQAGKGQGEKYHHQQYFDHSGEAVDGDSKSGGHIKHHVTKGYKNYHHKDEVGQTTSYIDSSGDSGDHHGKHVQHDSWGNQGLGGLHSDHHVSGFKGEKGEVVKNVSKEKKDDYKGNIAEFLYNKKPLSYNKKFYTHMPLQYVPYPPYFY